MFRSLAEGEAALADFAPYYNYHRLHGTDRGVDNVLALAHLKPWSDELLKAA